jgi:hypothetical protein
MTYDPELANRLREAMAGEDGVGERTMFGGLAFLVNGNLAVAASSRGGLMVRADPPDTDALIADEHAERFVMRGKEMAGWLRIRPAGVDTDADLARWVGIGVAYAGTLPPKQKRPSAGG